MKMLSRQRPALLLTGILLLTGCGHLYPNTTPTVTPTTITITTPDGHTPTITATATDGTTYHVDAQGRLNLPPGTYTITAAPYASGRYDYAAPTQTVTVHPGETPTLNITYVPITGALEVIVGDLDPTPDANAVHAAAVVTTVTVTGPNGYEKTFNGNGTYVLTNLTPGTYVVTGPNGQSSTFTVTAGQTAGGGAFTLSGNAQIAWTGLPSGVKPTLRLQSDTGATYKIPADLLATNLKPGTYTLKTTTDVKTGGLTYHADPVTFDVTLGMTSTPTLTFAPITGRAKVNVLTRAGVTPDVTLDGPGGFTRTFTSAEDVTLDDLTPGAYTLTARDVTWGGDTYAPTITPAALTVTAGQTANATVSYGVSTATLDVTVTGLPTGVTPTLTLRDPQDATTTVTAGAPTPGLKPGTYTLVSADVNAGGFTYRAPDTTVTLTAGQTTTITSAYAAIDGRVTVNVQAPQDAPIHLTLTDTHGHATDVTSSAADHLTPDAYTLNGTPLTVGDYDFEAPPTPVTVTAGQTTSASLTYAATTGALDVHFTGVPLNAALTLRRPDGGTVTVPDGAHLSRLTPGRYELTATLTPGDGYTYTASGGTAVTVTAGQTATLDATFTARDVENPKDVTLVASDITLTAPGHVTLTAGARDNVAVTAFRLKRGDDTVVTKDATLLGDGAFGVTFDLTDLPVGAHTYRVTALDAEGNATVSDAVTVTVQAANRAPTVTNALGDLTVTAGTSKFVDLSGVFGDADGDPLTFTAESSDPGLIPVVVSGSSLEIMAPTPSAGAATVTIHAADGRGGTVSTSFMVTATEAAPNRAPVIASLADVKFTRGGSAVLAGSSAFSDPDGDALTITATSDAPGVTASVSGQTVNVSGSGWANVTVTATDTRGASVSQTVRAISGVRQAFISDYVEGSNGRAAIQVYYPDDGASGMQSGYELFFYQYVKATGQVRVFSLPFLPFYPGMPYIILNSNFYDFFDITSAYYYNEEAYFSLAGYSLNALVLKKDGVIVDVLGDPTATTDKPILPSGGTLVRKSGMLFGSPASERNLLEYDAYPKDTFMFLGRHQP